LIRSTSAQKSFGWPFANPTKMLVVPFKSLASSFTRNDGLTLDGWTGGGAADYLGGFDIKDTFYGDALSREDFGEPIHVDTRYGGGFGTGFTGGAAGGWTVFNGPDQGDI
jgi:hypothetical protein